MSTMSTLVSSTSTPSMDDEAAQLRCAVCKEPHIPFELLRDGWQWVQRQPRDLLDLVYSHIDYSYTRCRAHHVHNDVCDEFICSACRGQASCQCGRFTRCPLHTQRCRYCEKVVCNDGTLLGWCADKCRVVDCSVLICKQCREARECPRCRGLCCDEHTPYCEEGDERMCNRCDHHCHVCLNLVCNFHSTACLAPACQSIACSRCSRECSHCQGPFCSIHLHKCTKHGCSKLIGTHTTCLVAAQCTSCGKYFCGEHQRYGHLC